LDWEIPLLLGFILLFSAFGYSADFDQNFVVDSTGTKHYVAIPESLTDNSLYDDLSSVRFTKFENPWNENSVGIIILIGFFTYLLVDFKSGFTLNSKILLFVYKTHRQSCNFSNPLMQVFEKNAKPRSLLKPKKIILSVLSLFLVISLIPFNLVPAFAADPISVSDSPVIQEITSIDPLNANRQFYLSGDSQSPTISDSVNVNITKFTDTEPTISDSVNVNITKFTDRTNHI